MTASGRSVPAIEYIHRPRTWATRRRAVLFDLLESTKAYVRIELKRREWQPVEIRPGLSSARVVVVVMVKDELPRLDHLLGYYRALGADHFVIVDNGSQDGSTAYLREQRDVSLFAATGEFADARYGLDWVNGILRRHCVGKWVLWVDADELLTFSSRPGTSLVDLVEKLEAGRRRSLQAIMLDLYGEGPSSDNRLAPGQDPLEVCSLFDKNGYTIAVDPVSRTGWIRGGVRGRFFDDPKAGPALNKTPLVRWRRHYVYLKATHQLWPRSLNASTRLGGALLHVKFSAVSAAKMVDDDYRAHHTDEYAAYDDIDRIDLRSDRTTRYTGCQCLVDIGLIDPWL